MKTTTRVEATGRNIGLLTHLKQQFLVVFEWEVIINFTFVFSLKDPSLRKNAGETSPHLNPLFPRLLEGHRKRLSA